MRLNTFESEKTGEKIFLDEIIEDNFPDGQLAMALLCSDMDGTMFESDLGLLVFLEKLSDPTFWTYPEDKFHGLLLPRHYRAVLGHGKSGGIPELAPQMCDLAMRLHSDIVDLYKLQRILLSENGNGKKLTIYNPIVNEFARKMVALDEIMVDLDSYFVNRFDGELLMRIRFFARKNKSSVTRLAKQVMARTEGDFDSIVSLGVHHENAAEMSGQMVSKEELPEHKIDRVPKMVEDVRKVICRAVLEEGASGRVVTTNLHEIAEVALSDSSYRYLWLDGNTTIASVLKFNPRYGNYDPRLVGHPVYGPEKVKSAKTAEASTGKRFQIALGDSPRNDGPMMIQALKNGGIVFLVGPDFETLAERFAPVYKRVRRLKNIDRRIICVETAA